MRYYFSFFSLLLMTFSVSAREGISSKRYELLSGVRKTTKKDEKSFWDRKYSGLNYVYGKTPAKFLAESYSYIPSGSAVLDMGMGEGRNAIFLARKGYKVTGVDISSVAIKKAKLLAREFDVRIKTVLSSMEHYKVSSGYFDAIICFYFVDRSLHRKMISWLKPGGLLIYEAYTDRQKSIKGFERYKGEYLLREGELIGLFPDLRILKFEEPLHDKNFRTSIILQKKP